MKVVVIGGTGHIGTYLIPRLIKEGYSVTNVSRGISQPYLRDPCWKSVSQVTLDRKKEEKKGTFGKKIRKLNSDIIIDLICFTPESVAQLVQELTGQIEHFLHCGTLWTYGAYNSQFQSENTVKKPITEYGKLKLDIEAYLMDQFSNDAFPYTIIHPGHITGQGWLCINPVGNKNLSTFQSIMRGGTVYVPDDGQTTLQHVHADDVAQAFIKAMKYREDAIGHSFNIASEKILTQIDCVTHLSRKYDSKVDIQLLAWEEWVKQFTSTEIKFTKLHMDHNSRCPIDKAHDLIGYRPNYLAEEAMEEAVDYYFGNKYKILFNQQKYRAHNKIYRMMSK